MYKKKNFTKNRYDVKAAKQNKEYMTIDVKLTNGKYPSEIVIPFKRKTVNELNSTANNILKESCAEVYRTIPAYIRNDAKIIMLTKKRITVHL